MTETLTQPGALDTLGINAKLFLAQLINVSVILFVLWKWAYTPLLKAMDAREKKITDGLDNAELATKQIAEATTKQRAMLDEAQRESQKMLEAARAEAEDERKKLTTETQADLERQLAEARVRLKAEKEAMFVALKGELANLVVAATKKVSVTHEKELQQGWIDEAMKEIESERV